MPQEYNAELIKSLSTDFPKRIEPNYAWGNALGGLLLTPRLRGQWCASCDENVNLFDHSGQGRTLTPNGAPGPQVQGWSISPYVQFGNVANAWWYSRVDEPGLDLVFYVAVWTWIRFNGTSIGASTGLIGKWTAPAQQSWMLYKDVANQIQFVISSTGADAFIVNAVPADFVVNEWLFVAGIFNSSSSLTLYIGNARSGILTAYQNIVGIPATMFNSNSPLEVGRISGGSYLGGDMIMWGLCEYPLWQVDIFNKFHQTRPLYMW